MLNLKLSKYYC